MCTIIILTASATSGKKLDREDVHQTEKEKRGMKQVLYNMLWTPTHTCICSDITADTMSEELGEGQIRQERLQEMMSTEDREDSTDSHICPAAGILSHSTCLSTT